MKKILLFIFVAGLSLSLFFSCKKKNPTNLANTSFIPRPASVVATGDAFKLKSNSTIYYQEGVDGLEMTANYLADELNKITGIHIAVEPAGKVPTKGFYLSKTDGAEKLGKEGYLLTIDKKMVTIKAENCAGNFYGVQTLLQTLPIKNIKEQPFIIATGEIRDSPQYQYRGMMLDVVRHFFKVEDVKKLIDYLSVYKMNILHLHLSDDQGWRIEIKSWPKLTEIGSKTQVGGGEGGFYTQEQYADIVKYASERHITIVPEIDMPGHTNAALASYAELNCDGKARELYTGTEVGFSTLCVDKDITYEFVDDVVREIAAITPGPWFHIGGDESLATKHDDFILFINKAQKIVEKNGKKVIGWDEIANANMVDEATIQFWSNEKNTKKGVNKGAKVIMSPGKRAYLDMKYDSTTHLGLSWAGYIEVDHGYNWTPEKLVDGVNRENIMGIEAPLWSETILNLDNIEYMVFPRIVGYAEIGWTAPELRKWDEYKMRLADHGARFEAMGIDFYKSPKVPWKE